MTAVGLRIDVDFPVGLRRGVPWLLDRLAEREMRATFFVVTGRNSSRRALRRTLDPEYLGRLRRLGPLRVVRCLGASLLRDEPVLESREAQAALDRIVSDGHELAAHGHDHAWWADEVWRAEPERLVRGGRPRARRARAADRRARHRLGRAEPAHDRRRDATPRAAGRPVPRRVLGPRAVPDARRRGRADPRSAPTDHRPVARGAGARPRHRCGRGRRPEPGARLRGSVRARLLRGAAAARAVRRAARSTRGAGDHDGVAAHGGRHARTGDRRSAGVPRRPRTGSRGSTGS